MAVCVGTFVNTAGLEFMSPLHYNYILSLLLVWVTGDGILAAYDLKAAESRINHLQNKLKEITSSKNTECSFMLKKIDDNFNVMLDIKTRLLYIQNHIIDIHLQPKKLAVSKSLDADVDFNIDVFTSNTRTNKNGKEFPK
jgi:hypothetical protein